MSIQYFILKPAVDTDETGHVFPAVESYDDYDFKGPRSVHKIKFNEFPDFEPDIRFRLAKGAKLCDVLGQATISGSGLLISEKVKTILEQYKTVEHAFYKVFIEHNNENHNYFWVQFVWQNATDHIIFNRSKFIIKQYSRTLGNIEILNYKDLLLKQGELGFIKMIYNVETTMKKTDYELFIHGLNSTIFVSEKLSQELKNCTGILCEPAKNLEIIE